MSHRDTVILGLDPGIAITGYGLIRQDGSDLIAIDYGVITTPAGTPLPIRLRTIYHELTALIARHQPTQGAVEELFFARNVRTALTVGQARGVVLLALAEAGLPTHEYTPLQVKQAVVGYGQGTKQQVQEMVRILLSLNVIPQPDDAADALAVAICHAHSARLSALLGE
ncbi:MAG: crossover junction endodeoxyribonuclease RuvC [Chloroflexi bacterium]|nr:crossover junction endodeoxyribonuclease RuvC [Chloroflexota bacterium]MBU1751201.1 crossover junction endodeoxyribonuclease RuvC [Chloroflexota bacterium]